MTLSDFIEQQRHKPFKWGEHDCCMLAARWLELNGAADLAAEFRGKYSCELGALRVIRQAGFVSLLALLQAKLGDSVAPLLLQRGAVVLLDTPEGDVVGLYQGHDCFALAQTGLVSYPKANIKMGWNV